MNTAKITSFAQVLDRINIDGYLWNVGQISNSVLRQIQMAISQEILIQKTEGYPLRMEGGEMLPIYLPGRRFSEGQ